MKIRLQSRESGFTLIELMVVMAIIATLAGLGMVTVPRMLRKNKLTKAMDNLRIIHQTLFDYEDSHGHMPTGSGEAFVLGPWIEGRIDRTVRDAEPYFDPSTGNKPDEDFTNVDEMMIDYVGPDQTGRRKRLMTSDRNANDKIIVTNSVPPVQTDEDLDILPHSALAVVILTLGGSVDTIEANEFEEGYPVIGPDSSYEGLRWIALPIEWR